MFASNNWFLILQFQTIYKKLLLKFFKQNNYTEKAKILYFLNLVYFSSLVGLWQNHAIYLPLTGLMSHYTTPFTERVVNKFGSVCPCYWSFFYGTLHMWARIDEEENYKEKMFNFQTSKKIIKNFPMTGRLIVTQGYVKPSVLIYFCRVHLLLEMWLKMLKQ